MLINIPIFTLFERKILSYIQNRKGPNKVSMVGLLQPVRDGIKLLLKNLVLPHTRNVSVFLMRPLLSFLLMGCYWLILTLNSNYCNIIFIRIIFFFILSSLKVFCLLWSGWSRKCKYSLIGSFRGVIQVISYEIGLLTLVFLPASFCFSLKFFSFMKKFFFRLTVFIYPVLVMFLICLVGETNRAPFDFAEGERELVSGFNTEYSSFSFALLFLAEYGRIIFVSMMLAVLFGPTQYNLKIIIGNLICYLIIVFRGRYPRWRIDFLMSLGWKVILPLGFCYFVYVLI